MKKAIIALLVVVMAFLSFQKYQEHTEIELLTRAISDTTARASTTLDILRGGHRVPIADFIKQTEAHNQALSNHIISIKSNIGSKRHVETAFAISYIEQTAIVFTSGGVAITSPDSPRPSRKEAKNRSSSFILRS